MFEQLAFVEHRAGTDEGDQVRCIHYPPPGLFCVDELVGHGNSRRYPGPLVTLVRNRSVAKELSIGFVVRRRTQCAAGYL